MDLIHWDESLETGLSEVDKQHHHLVDVTNRFGTLLSHDEIRPADIASLLEELISYTQYHFEEEEKVMRQAGIDQRHLDLHEKEHQSFFQDVTVLQQQWLSDEKVSYGNLFEYLVNWLVFHILGSDKNMARQIDAINTGRTPNQAFEEQEKNLV
ncbi:MAG: hemerythrin family protein [Desulfuromonadales bacterium]|nr:hemerythrin family protein [Desulfuromonadales bacterium]MBN2793159.1 hemerythrin family protein [Desulfuromonadales bacterium]